MQTPPRSYLVKTQQGDVRRNRRRLNRTPAVVAPTYDALPADFDIQSDLDEGVDEPMAVVAPPVRKPQPPEPRRNLASLRESVNGLRLLE